jgi:hypothetical protein
MSATPLRQLRRSTLDLARLDALCSSPLFAYGVILALQARVIWNVWQYKDLTPGDTSGYFVDASSWAHGLHDDIVWSPLYTDFFGTIDAAVRPVYAALMVHRVAIVLAAALLVLGLMRTLVSPAMALLITAWWVVLPPAFNVQYEVHLFGLLPILVAALVVARKPGRRELGVTFALLAGATVLLRNELLIATVIFGATILGHELRQRRRLTVSKGAYLRAYGTPLLVLCVVVAGAYWRSYDQGSNAKASFTRKQELNMCQVYATNYQQRYPTRFPGNPFTECSVLMKHDFRRSMPSLLQATVANPRAIAAMVGWNAILLPSGLQVALFGATVAGTNPDYFPVKEHAAYALVLSIIALSLLLAGFLASRSDREFWRNEWLAPRAWAVVLLAAVGVTTVIVALTQRPRPEYMYGLTVGLLGLIGVCTSALLRRLNGTRFLAPIAIVLILALLVAMPGYYQKGPRPLLSAVDRLQVARVELHKPGSVLIAAEANEEICGYLSETYARRCTSPSWPAIEAQLARGIPIRAVLDQARATAIYAEPLLTGDPSIAKLVAAPRRYGWREAAAGVTEGRPWHVLVRAS